MVKNKVFSFQSDIGFLYVENSNTFIHILCIHPLDPFDECGKTNKMCVYELGNNVVKLKIQWFNILCYLLKHNVIQPFNKTASRQLLLS